MRNEETARSCYEELKPAIDDLCRIMAIAPLTDHKKVGLGLLVAAHVVGGVVAMMDKAEPDGSFHTVGDVCDLLRESAGHISRSKIHQKGARNNE